ncbi:MBL fold metallo-hydrolase [Corticibacter populi]|uniref:MBL fold metallo-hydrolase n=1 Tax=Corticibacter populi TaxID=1550736 RepID=A0A3M6QI19_9BURK|nr:MBL fold metallo-hydrolase [Corticibacter populi]RMX02585.1 MBL fold metallo-hydrolase [Corticibacter populi]RZS33004.1 glyoxylase-like metal-dependent hydrolase (beta-lactamase superfamily II) [Corticibacter populi]
MHVFSFWRPFALAGALGLAMAAGSAPALAAGAVPAVAGAPLHIEVFNPGEEAIFAVSSVLVSGESDALLIDAQFSAAEARKLAERVAASGKTLRTIYISHGDPDYYFGLDTLRQAFPQAAIVATPQTIAHIQATKDEKLKVWGPQLGSNAPQAIVVPQPLQGDTLTLEGQELKIVGLAGPAPDRSVVWIPSIQTVAGGIPVQAGLHVWMADTQTPQSHADWLAMLETIEALQPRVVVPGHFAPGARLDLSAVAFTADYIRAFDEEAAKARDADALIAAMEKRYPGLEGEGGLVLSAKVAKGEMVWP